MALEGTEDSDEKGAADRKMPELASTKVVSMCLREVRTGLQINHTIDIPAKAAALPGAGNGVIAPQIVP